MSKLFLEANITKINKSPLPEGKTYRRHNNTAEKLNYEKEMESVSGQRNKPSTRKYIRVTNELKAQVLNIYRSPPPSGKERWSCKDIAEKLVHDKTVDSICRTRMKYILKTIFPDRHINPQKWHVALSKADKKRIAEVLESKWESRIRKRYALILLELDEANGRTPTSRKNITAKTGASPYVISRLRKKYDTGGIDLVFSQHKKLAIDEKNSIITAHILSVYHSPPPSGKEHWSCMDIVDKLIRDKVVTSITSQKVSGILRKENARIMRKAG